MKVFVGEQRFDQWWLYAILIIPLFIVLLAFLFDQEKASNDKESIFAISVSVLTMAIVFGLVLFIRLRTKIDEKGIYFQFSPLHYKQKFLPWNAINECYVRKYRPIREYGGWGFRTGFGRRRGRALNIRGNIGIQLELKNGKKLLLGTQKENEVQTVLDRYKDKLN